MKLAVLYGKESDAHHHFIEKGSDYFDTVLGVPLANIKVIYGEESSKIVYKDADLCDFDAVFLRLFDSDLIHGEPIPEILKDNGVYTQMDRDSLAIASNKFYTMRVLAQGGVNVPQSTYVASTEEAVKAATSLGYPVIVKLISGYGGKGVMRASGVEELKLLIDTLELFGETICLQEFIENPGEDVRVLVVGDDTYCYKRVGGEGEWRSNVSSGGEMKEYDASGEVRETALKAARLAGFDFCGVDVIESAQGPTVVEINSSPGCEPKDSEVLGVDINEKVLGMMKDKTLAMRAAVSSLSRLNNKNIAELFIDRT